MNHKKISIIIRSNCDISAITSLMQQNNNSWDCYVVNNIIQNIEQFILNDNRFKILNNEQEAIKLSCGDYILFIDSSDILVNDAIDNILHTIQFTNADVIKFDSKLLKGDLPESADTKCKIKYIFNKNTVLNYAFNDLSEFCFKKSIMSGIDINQPNNSLLVEALSKATDMALAQKICVIKQKCLDISVTEIIYNYEHNNNKLSEVFWKEYFRNITPQIILQTIKNNDKTSFVTFCHKVPSHLIPLRYRTMCYILKKTNK